MKLVKTSLLIITIQVIATVVFSNESCDRSKCLGPLRFYDEIQCKPIYKQQGDCCPVSYDCSHLQARKKDKCYIGLKEYEVGKIELPKGVDSCKSECMCSDDEIKGAKINCPVVDCPEHNHSYDTTNQKDCYYDFSDGCCSNIVCPKEGEGATCTVGEDTYQEGDFFDAPNQPTLQCQCLPGFSGELVKPFCILSLCGDDLYHPKDNANGCAPVFYGPKSVGTSCRVDTKCPDALDYAVSSTTKRIGDQICKFGGHILHIGDKLFNNGTEVSNQCLECTCEIPPFLSCIQYPSFDCKKLNK